MFKNLHIKLFALILATLFWFMIVSIENTFVRFPQEIPIEVFNQAPELALASTLGGVKLAIRAQDPTIIPKLSASDFEAYVDLRSVGAGTRRLPIAVTSKNPDVSVVRVEPSEVDVVLEPVRQKIIPVTADVTGVPAKGYRVNTVTLSRPTITVSAAQAVLSKVAKAKAKITLDGREKESASKKVEIVVYDANGVALDGVTVVDKDLQATVTIVEIESTKEVGVQAKFTGALANGVIKTITIEPAVISVSGLKDALAGIDVLQTEAIDLKDVVGSFEKTVKLGALPQGLSLATGEATEVKVKVEVAKPQ